MLISEVSEKYDISPDTLRYDERVGLLPPVRRGKNGLRDFSENDLSWIAFIKCMRSAGLPVEQLAQYVQFFPQGDAAVAARKQILQEQREQIAGRMDEGYRAMDERRAIKALLRP